MMLAAAFVPTPPLLVPEIAGGSAGRNQDLRRVCREAVATLAGADRLVVVSTAPETRTYEGRWDPRPFGVSGPSVSALPYALGIGEWLTRDLDLPTTFHGVAGVTPKDGAGQVVAAAVGGEHRADSVADDLAGPAGGSRVGLLVCGDGSACRDEKAPGYLDPRAEAFDEQARAALASGEPARLLALDAGLGDALLATGVRPWHVLAHAAGRRRTARVTYAKAPYGVAYLVGTWT